MREYQIITSGEDGMVFWWSFVAPYNGNDLSHVERQNARDDSKLLVKVDASQIQTVRSNHQIHLTE